MAGSLQGETVVVVGRGSGIARAIVDAAMAEGAHVVAAGRNREALEAAYTNTTVSVKSVDVTDETSIAALADQVSSVDHVVSTVSAAVRRHHGLTESAGGRRAARVRLRGARLARPDVDGRRAGGARAVRGVRHQPGGDDRRYLHRRRGHDRGVPGQRPVGPRVQEAAVVTFLATASGVTLLGIGSAFWGLLAGVLTSVIAAVGRRRRAAASPPAPAPQPVTAASRTPERTSA